MGSHLVDRLMTPGEKVICLVNFFTGRKENVAQWIGHPRFDLIRHYVTEPIKFLGTYNMLGLARRVAARLLLASTSEVYDDPRSISSPRATADVSAASEYLGVTL